MRILLILSFLPFLALTVIAEYEPEESIVSDPAPPQPEEESIKKASADWKPREGDEDMFNNEHLDGAGFFLPYKDLDLERNIFGEGAKSPLKESPYDTAPAMQPPPTLKYAKVEPAKETPAPYAKETPAPYAEETHAPYAKETHAPYAKETSAPYVKETPPPYAEETPAPSAKETHAPYAEETHAPYAKETHAPYAKETPAPYVKETPPPYAEETPAPSAKETYAPYEKETKAPYAIEQPAPYEKETEAPYATEQPAPYEKETKAPYPTEQPAPYEKETKAPYPTEQPAPYEKETKALYPTEQPAPYEKETKAPYATEQPAPYEKETKAPYATEQPESYAKETTAYATEQPEETTYAAKDSYDGPKKPKTDNEAISQEIERIDKTIADIDNAIKSTAEHNPMKTQAGSYGVEDFQNEESLYKNHPAQPADTRRMFDHTLEVPMLKIATLGRFKQFIKMFKLGGRATDKEGVCDRKPNCDPKSKYRTYDGTCNNLKVTNHGAVNAPYRRLLPPAYGDGNYLPRGVSKFSKEHGYVSSLPSPRKISDTVMEQGNETLTESSIATHMVMQWGQFIDHDMMSTSKEAFDCCDPEIRNTFRCFPIDIPAEDSFYSQFGKQCLDFTRSDIHCKSSLKYAEQFNTQSSFLDASHIYGSSKEAADMLRGGKNRKGGRLLGNSALPHFLPSKFDIKMKNKEHDLGTDFVAGDMRVETQSSLTAVHNLFFNEHNRIADGLYQELKKRYSMPDTDLDELVFQETRRLVIAEIQEVTYREFLPVVLGKQAMIENKLEHTAECIYNPETDPCIINAFGAAAFRFGHSLIQSIFRGENQPWRLGKFFADSRFARSEGGTAYVNELKGLSKQPCQRADLHISQQMTQNLFCNNQTAPGGGHDIASYNIQRGRDHGIPGYAKFRELCGLYPIKSLKETPEGVDPASWSKIQSVYGSIDEIDLFVGGLAEIPAKDGLIGPTFSCIIGKQFKALMEGDRFFSHHTGGPDIFPLKGAAAAGLGSRTLAAIICEVTGADKLPPNVFQLIDEAGMKACSELPKLDLMKIASEIEIH